MNILAIETTGKYGSASVINETGEVFSAISTEEMNHLKGMMILIDEAIREAVFIRPEINVKKIFFLFEVEHRFAVIVAGRASFPGNVGVFDVDDFGGRLTDKGKPLRKITFVGVDAYAGLIQQHKPSRVGNGEEQRSVVILINIDAKLLQRRIKHMLHGRSNGFGTAPFVGERCAVTGFFLVAL